MSIKVHFGGHCETLEKPDGFDRDSIEISRNGDLLWIGIFVGDDVYYRPIKAWAAGTWKSAEIT